AWAVFSSAVYNAYANTSSTVPIAYPNFTVSLADFGRTSLSAIDQAFTINLVPSIRRCVILRPDFHGKLDVDPSHTVSMIEDPDEPEERPFTVPKMASFLPIQAPTLTTVNPTP